jgi:hypothetical protein
VTVISPARFVFYSILLLRQLVFFLSMLILVVVFIIIAPPLFLVDQAGQWAMRRLSA